MDIGGAPARLAMAHDLPAIAVKQSHHRYTHPLINLSESLPGRRRQPRSRSGCPPYGHIHMGIAVGYRSPARESVVSRSITDGPNPEQKMKASRNRFQKYTFSIQCLRQIRAGQTLPEDIEEQVKRKHGRRIL